jgi:putative YphP/YqiW family bacilliredoxin
MYPPELVQPMKDDLTNVGFNQLTSTTEVDDMVQNSEGETLLIVVNSVCGCAAGNMRPGVKLSLNSDKKPTTLATVFAGVDGEATNQARKYFLPYPPSSPSIALFKDGKLVHF